MSHVQSFPAIFKRNWTFPLFLPRPFLGTWVNLKKRQLYVQFVAKMYSSCWFKDFTCRGVMYSFAFSRGYFRPPLFLIYADVWTFVSRKSISRERMIVFQNYRSRSNIVRSAAWSRSVAVATALAEKEKSWKDAVTVKRHTAAVIAKCWPGN